jgi:hypothetical protein
MPADLALRDRCIYCGDAEAVLPVRRLALDGGARYAHPSCVSAALRRDPSDAIARSCAVQFGMRRDLEQARAAADASASGR